MGSNQSPTGHGALVTELEEQEDMPNPSPTTLDFSPTDSFSPTEMSQAARAAADAIDDPSARANRRLARAGEGRNKRKASPPGSTTARNAKNSRRICTCSSQHFRVLTRTQVVALLIVQRGLVLNSTQIKLTKNKFSSNFFSNRISAGVFHNAYIKRRCQCSIRILLNIFDQ